MKRAHLIRPQGHIKILRRFRAHFREEKLDAEMAEGMRAHVELQLAENERRGLSTDEERYAAQRAFGGVERVKERARAARVDPMVALRSE